MAKGVNKVRQKSSTNSVRGGSLVVGNYVVWRNYTVNTDGSSRVAHIYSVKYYIITLF